MNLNNLFSTYTWISASITWGRWGSPRDGTQVVKIGSKHLYLPSHLAPPPEFLFSRNHVSFLTESSSWSTHSDPAELIPLSICRQMGQSSQEILEIPCIWHIPMKMIKIESDNGLWGRAQEDTVAASGTLSREDTGRCSWRWHIQKRG